MSPSEPGGTLEASCVSSAKDRLSDSFLTHSVSAPDVAMPPARTSVSERGPAVLQRFGDGSGLPTISMVSAVVPYMTIRSPGSRTPMLAASDQASTVPVATGIPAGSPVVSAASCVISPAISAASAGPGAPDPGQPPRTTPQSNDDSYGRRAARTFRPPGGRGRTRRSA